MFVAMIVVTQTSLPVIEVETSLVVLPSHLPVVARKLLISVTASPFYTLYILIVRHDEVTELPVVSTLHQSRAAAGLEALKKYSIKLRPAQSLSCYSTSHWKHFRDSPSPTVRARTRIISNITVMVCIFIIRVQSSQYRSVNKTWIYIIFH